MELLIGEELPYTSHLAARGCSAEQNVRRTRHAVAGSASQFCHGAPPGSTQALFLNPKPTSCKTLYLKNGFTGILRRGAIHG